MEILIEANSSKVMLKDLVFINEKKEIHIPDSEKKGVDKVEGNLLVKILFTKVIELKDSHMDEVGLNGRIKIGMKEIESMGRDKDSEYNSIIRLKIFTKENLLMVNLMVLEFISMEMAPYIVDISVGAYDQELELCNLMMKRYILENSFKIKSTAQGIILDHLVVNLKEITSTICETD